MCIYKKKISVLHVTMFACNFKSFLCISAAVVYGIKLAWIDI